MAVLEFAWKYKEALLYGRYAAGRDQIRKYEQNAPYAYLVPQQQRDRVAPVEMLRRLAFNGVKVYQPQLGRRNPAFASILTAMALRPPDRHMSMSVSSGLAISLTRVTKSGKGLMGNCFFSASHW